jgi:hypothetical protein
MITRPVRSGRPGIRIVRSWFEALRPPAWPTVAPAAARSALVLCLLALLARPAAAADVIADWGTVATPLETETTFSFAESDISRNFTHDYLFSLAGTAGATYAVTFDIAACTNGCGNPDITYGIYDANGGLVGTVAPSDGVTLAAGDYSFVVNGNGMGAGNSVDYAGTVTFSAATSGTVSAAPEPAAYALTLIGLGLVGWVARRNGLVARVAPIGARSPTP